MKLLLDTHIILWAAAGSLPENALEYILDESNELFFSSASIWEASIKSNLRRDDFDVDPQLLYHNLIANGYQELVITAKHTLTINTLPNIHKDPFDRLLIGQAITEGLHLITADKIISEYAAPIIFISHSVP